MVITILQLHRIMPHAPWGRVAGFVKSFNKWSTQFGIDSTLRAAHYIAQVAHETGELQWLEELSSGKQYEGRRDLGNTQPGDGPRFKGRGYLQTTGRANYQRYADSPYCVGILMQHPEWLSKQPGCQKASMFFWQEHGLNELADRDDVRAVTRRINGGYNGLAQRCYFLDKAKRVLCP